MADHEVVTHQQWVGARLKLLKKEKEFSRRREELTQLRRELPWEKVDKWYGFDADQGHEMLGELFGTCSQLIIYHFMFDPDWSEGCKVCSMLADHYDPLILHLRHRDVSLVTVSRAPLDKLQAFKERMGWTFKWVSSYQNDFNRDYHVSFTQDELDSGTAFYNYQHGAKFPVTECPGISSFFKDGDGNIFHTYSSFGRGLENFLGIYNFLDIVSKGRDEREFPYPMAWVRHKDRYDDESFKDPYLN